ncbi:CHY zinc finger protein [Klenkia sp. PcliD-1-E]|uniref:CHY zinc finger protein n=1 Tax=Klenkia sp. PcliD-1-E TaxID=2954492 RepID=UPI0020971C4C|nr:CHY zinc finger protein [Klenkia sp. PcliD-1-E]MCO7218902.1 CHY zinc finger protein [Klenkia sp. PcliD-1-E]
MARVELGGRLVDDQSRCAHYATALDVVAIRFACCTPYWGCHLCHAECADHPAVVWPADDRAAHAVVCGVCRHTLAVEDYVVADGCPHCAAPFNPGCRAHHHLYFG